MKGKYRVVVSTKRLKYDFELHRNLTIIQGDSATGKTTMIDMIREYKFYGLRISDQSQTTQPNHTITQSST